jgi:hypothetical protein
VAATDGPVRVHRTVRSALRGPETSERVADGVLRSEVRARRPWLVGGELSYRIEVPAAAAVRVSTGAGAVDVDGISGEVDVRTNAGRVRLANLGGRVRATTQAGQVLGRGPAAPHRLVAHSNAGQVRVRRR